MPARMNPRPRDERGGSRAGIHAIGELQRLLARGRRHVHPPAGASGGDGVLQLPHPGLGRKPRIRLVGRRGHGGQRGRRSIAHHIEQLVRSGPLAGRARLRLADTAGCPVRPSGCPVRPLAGLADLPRLGGLDVPASGSLRRRGGRCCGVRWRRRRLLGWTARRARRLHGHGVKVRHVEQSRKRASGRHAETQAQMPRLERARPAGPSIAVQPAPPVPNWRSPASPRPGMM